MDQNERRRRLIRALLDERAEYRSLNVPVDVAAQKRLLRALLNLRPPMPAADGFLSMQDAYLRAAIVEKGVTDGDALPYTAEGFALWQGDITTLRCDAIVNAANSALLGCFCPNHDCIDNAIHTFAGVQLRLACEEIMRAQGDAEPTGHAKITPAFNLPCRYVLHTVGPIVEGRVTARDREMLAACYRSCLELAAKNRLESIAFCCISTGEFHFPNLPAAEIAVATVRDFMQRPTSIRKVIFNVFKDCDKAIYARLLGGDRAPVRGA